jgi:hypothetical protein
MLLDGLPYEVPLSVSISGGFPTQWKQTVIPRSDRESVLEFSVPRTALLRGRLVYEDGDPAAAIIVRTYASRGTPESAPRAGTNVDGTFEIRSVPFGSLSYHIECNGEELRRVNIDTDVCDLGTIVLPAMGVIEGEATLKGRALDNDCAPLQFELVEDGIRRGSLSVLGTQFEGRVPLGEYALEVVGPCGVLTSIPVRVPAQGLEIALDSLVCGVRLTGVARDDEPSITLVPLRENEGRISRGREVSLGGSDCRTKLLWDDKGAVATFLLPGKHEAYVQTLGHPPQRCGEYVLALGDVVEIALPPIRALGRIEGIVVDGTGGHIAGASITIASEVLDRPKDAGFARQTCVSGEDGTFAFGSVSEGSWRVFPASLGHRAVDGVSIAVAADQTAYVRLESGSPGKCRLNVTEFGTPCSGASVTLRPENDRLQDRHSRAGLTDKAGTWVAESLAPGRYRILAEVGKLGSGGYRTARVVTVASGNEQVVAVDVGESAITVQFRDRGTPVADVTGGMIFQKDRWSFLDKSLPGAPGLLQASVDDGEAVFVIATSSQRRLAGSSAHQSYRLGRAKLSSAAHSQVTIVDVSGVDCVIKLDEIADHSRIPLAWISSLDGIDVGYNVGSGMSLAYEDIGNGSRKFIGLPAGARVSIGQTLGIEEQVYIVGESDTAGWTRP